jgi:DNA invertase Pin-like site-specific DNA recombinase
MNKKKAGAYLRVVTQDRNEIDEQKRNIENAIFKSDYELVDYYIDHGSGASLEREGIRKLLDDAKNNKINAVFINTLDGLSTQYNNTTELMEMLSGFKIRVYSVSDKRFLNDPNDILSNLSREIYNTLNEMEESGITLSKDNTANEKTAEKDPSIRLQNKIIEAYLQINNENGAHV